MPRVGGVVQKHNLNARNQIRLIDCKMQMRDAAKERRLKMRVGDKLKKIGVAVKYRKWKFYIVVKQ